MTAMGGTANRHDGGDARHDDGNPRLWDGGAIVARRGRSTLLIAVTGGGLLVRRQRRQREDLATLTSKRSICSQGRGGYDDNDINPRGNDDNDTTISLAMAMATRVAGDKESVGRKSDGDNKKGCGRATAMATKRAMAAATSVAGDEEGNGLGGESDGDTYKEGNGEEEGEYKGGKRAMVMARKMGRATRVMATATKRVMARKRARAIVILSSESKINV